MRREYLTEVGYTGDTGWFELGGFKKVYEGIWSLQWNLDMLAIFSISLL